MEKIATTAKRKGLSVEINREEFALSLKTYRIRQQLTQKELADKWEVSRWTLLRAEKAKPISWATAYLLFAKLSRALEDEP